MSFRLLFRRRWHPQLSGASFFGSDFIGDVLRELDRDLGVDVRRRPLLVISVIGVQSSGKSTLTLETQVFLFIVFVNISLNTLNLLEIYL